MADFDSNSSAVNNKREEAGDGQLTAAQIESSSYGEGKPRTFWGKLKASLKRFWYLYLLVFLACVILAVMLLIFVGIHNIAQSKINAAKLDVLGISVTDTKADSFLLSINSTLKSGTTKATVSEFDGVMYLEDEPSHRPFVTIRFPKTHNKRFQYINISQEVSVLDEDALADFNTHMVLNETVRVTVLGHPTVKVPGISKKYGITFKKTITMNGLNRFKGIDTYGGAVNISNFTDGTNFHATTTIPNPSVFTFEIGNITFATFLNNSRVGSTYMDNVTLYPGNNTFAIRSLIENAPVLNAVQAPEWCADGILPFDLSGRESMNHGENLTYFTTALGAANTTTYIDMDTPLRALGLNPKCSS